MQLARGIEKEDILPFRSQAQRGYLYAHDPKVAKEFEAATPKGKKLPKKVTPKKRPKKK